MAEEKDIRIVSWPKEPAALEHRFDPDEPCPVSISFDETPAQVVIRTDPQQKLDVNMDMDIRAKNPIPVCISMCEPLCLDSDYTIGINIFDNPFSTIRVRGRSKLSNCRDTPEPKPVCVDFTNNIKQGTVFTEPFVHEGLTFIPLGESIRGSDIGDPEGQIKLAFPRQGIRVEFPGPVNDIKLTVNNYAGPTLDINAYQNATLVNEFTEDINNTVKNIQIAEDNVTAIEIKGGDNEASIIDICFTLVIR